MLQVAIGGHLTIFSCFRLDSYPVANHNPGGSMERVSTILRFYLAEPVPILIEPFWKRLSDLDWIRATGTNDRCIWNVAFCKHHQMNYRCKACKIGDSPQFIFVATAFARMASFPSPPPILAAN